MALPSNSRPQLSPREVEVLLRVCRPGDSSGAAAEELGMSLDETAYTLRRIRRTLGVASTSAALDLVGPLR